jgi:phosphoribosylformimino-5-aminoimidazole carboxamide ribotide isomerase
VLIIPAIDLKDGRCVRLKQGDMASATVFSDDPVAMARHWLAQGAKRLHIVDLNGAIAGRPKNEKVIRDVIKAVGEQLPIQLGGGIRDLDTIESYIDAGVTWVVIGTAAVKTPATHFPATSSPGSTRRKARSRSRGGRSSPGTTSWTSRRNSRSTAWKRSSTPTSAATG